ncbi:RIP metalloprotease RseP [Pikeienuella piscinae]|uniref:Zinc metalloprotease n=1 Tax=Pikeienuella piscinae TaxID=2748098 RepID=A0A7L5BXB6_9RHOB|nr:RIP metalloprotease RseP [Pikeienuella piscinae]QIE56081.1 RIP metalloprotease RseP [Pikeienuella piscinae]
MSYIAEIPYVGWVIPFLVVLGVVVFVHEYGHYIVGRWVGIRAEVFSIGFGPELLAWRDKRGMRWRVGALPLGGYVKFAGDMNAASAGVDREALARMSAEERKGAFHTAAIWRRALTVLAGPVANFILSILVFAFFAMLAGREVNEPVIGSIRADANPELGLMAGDRVIAIDGNYVESFSDILVELAALEGQRATALVDRGAGEEEIEIFYLRPARVDEVVPGGAAADAGLQPDDVVTAVDGEPTPSFDSLRARIAASGGAMLSLDVTRGDEKLVLSMTPEMVEMPGPDGAIERRPMIGVRNMSFGGIEPIVETANPFDALTYGAARTWAIIAGTMDYLGDMITGAADSSQLGGPIQIAKVSGQAAEQGLESLAMMIALISTSIGLINLFPIPVLDGGHLVFYALEAVRGKPLRARWQEIGNGVGFGMIMLLMVFATYNDLLR